MKRQLKTIFTVSLLGASLFLMPAFLMGCSGQQDSKKTTASVAGEEKKPDRKASEEASSLEAILDEKDEEITSHTGIKEAIQGILRKEEMVKANPYIPEEKKKRILEKLEWKKELLQKKAQGEKPEGKDTDDVDEEEISNETWENLGVKEAILGIEKKEAIIKNNPNIPEAKKKRILAELQVKKEKILQNKR